MSVFQPLQQGSEGNAGDRDCGSMKIPQPLHTLVVALPDGATLRVRQHGNPNGPRLLLSHGNGFAIDGYIAFWHRLLRDFDVIVYDQRNHGQNPPNGGHGHHLTQFARDLETILSELVSVLGRKPIYGLFHSISSVSALWHALSHPWPWGGLILIDPPLVPTADHPMH